MNYLMKILEGLIILNYKNILVFMSMLLLTLIIIGGVSASDDVEATDNTDLDDLANDDVSNVNTIEKTGEKNIKQQATVYVSNSGKDSNSGTSSKPYKTISKAISTSSNNTKIVFKDGTYNLNYNSYTINKNLTITSNNKNNVIINAKTNDKDLFTVTVGNTLSISNLQFKNINRQSIIVNKGTVKLSNVDFVDNKIYGPSKNKKAIVNNYGKLTVNKCNFRNNYGYNGSAIYNVANTTITNSNLTKGNALFGGAIYSHYNNVVIKNCNIIDNTVNASGMYGWDSEDYVYTGGLGGAIFNRAKMDINNTKFQANKIPDGQAHTQMGGAIVNYGNLKINNSKILNSFVYGSGGAIYNENILTLTNSYINNNYAEMYCGGIINNNKATITNTTINGNTGFYNSAIINNGKLKLLDSIVNSNKGGIRGVILNNDEMLVRNLIAMKNNASQGGVFFNEGKLTIHTSKLTENYADFGGVIYDHGDTYINSSKINSNKAIMGGSIESKGAKITIKATELNSNKAEDYGGAISATDSTLTISNCTIKGNNLTTKMKYDYGYDYVYAYSGSEYNSYGGALYLNGNTTKVINTNICYNTADCGGAIMIKNGTLLMNVSNVSGNVAHDVGGAISTECDENENNPYINIFKTNINYNYAGEGGHAIYDDYLGTMARIYINNSNINYNGRSPNSSDKNVVICEGASLNLYKVNIKKNNGTIISAMADIKIDNCDISDNIDKKGNLTINGGIFTITNTRIMNNDVKNVLCTYEGQGTGKLSVSYSTLYNKKASYEIYNEHSSSSISNVKCDNNWWGTTYKPTNRVHDCNINSYYKGLN